MQLHDLTWPEVDNYLQEKDGIIIPIGSTEQHGPSGVIGTDAMVAEAIAVGIGLQVNALVGPVLGLGVAEHHMGFAGTLTLRPSTLIALINDYVCSLLHHGFRYFYFLNGHGGNIATLKAAFAEIHAQERQKESEQTPYCTFANWYDLDEVVKLRKQYYGDREGYHATPSEIAVVQYLRNDLIRSGPQDPPVSNKGAVHGALDFRRKYPDGRVASHPSMATPQQGQLLFDAAVSCGAEQVALFFAENEN